MLRTLSRALALLLVLAPLCAAAQLDVPPNVNLHNGYVEVINHVTYRDGYSSPGYAKLHGPIGLQSQGDVFSGSTIALNHCCIAAGTRYIVELVYSGAGRREFSDDFTARLCNIRGIPFGYAAIEYTGEIYKTPPHSGTVTRYEARISSKRVDTGCPRER